MHTILLLLALAAPSPPTADAPASRISYDYPWCVMGGEMGYDCSYSTRAQCLASASGRSNVYCDLNPRASIQEQPSAGRTVHPRRAR
ncbi:DUF3551 domain-containing protein [Bradyrhizobium sp. LLZ17]|uniref:DUF3551 domain-containing protein n=1 Tax=Bradyrhizobium sp. LLZ17 TaxID=3239388 RepID=A0AB39XIT1_9BRAD